MIDLFTEIQENAKEEKLIAVLKQTMRIVLISGVFALLFIVSFNWYQTHKKNTIEKTGLALANALKFSPDSTLHSKKVINITPQTNLLLEKISTQNNIYGVLANFYTAKFNSAITKPSKVIGAYQRIIENKTIDDTIKNYATVNLMMTQLSYRQEKAEKVIHHLNTSILKNQNYKNTPFGYSAQLLKISLLACADKKSEALEALQSILNSDQGNEYANLLKAIKVYLKIKTEGVK